MSPCACRNQAITFEVLGSLLSSCSSHWVLRQAILSALPFHSPQFFTLCFIYLFIHTFILLGMCLCVCFKMFVNVHREMSEDNL